MAGIGQNTKLYKFYDKVSDKLMNNLNVSPPDEEHGDIYWDFWFGFDDSGDIHYRLSKGDVEKIRKRHNPIVELTRDIITQTLNDFFIIFEDYFGYFNIDDIVNILSRFFIPKLYNKYIKEDDASDAPIVLRESKKLNRLEEKVVDEIMSNLEIKREFVTIKNSLIDALRLRTDIEIFYDPYHSNIKKFDYRYVLSEISNFVSFYLYKTLGLGEKGRLFIRRFDDPMVNPIANKIVQKIFKIAKSKRYVKGLENVRTTLNEQSAPQIRKNVGKVYHKNGFINRVVGDILKLTKLKENSVLFDLEPLPSNFHRGLRRTSKPKILYNWDDNNGLSSDSIEIIRGSLPKLVKEYMKMKGILSHDDDSFIEPISEVLSNEIIEQIDNYQRDEDWEHWDEEWILAESTKQIEFLNRVKKKVVNSISEDDRFWNFNDMIEPTYDGEVVPVRVQKQGILNNLRGDWLFNRFREFYGELYGLSYVEVEEIYNAALYHIFKTSRLNSMNDILIGDWDLEYTPSLIIREEDWSSYLTRDYDLSKIEDYIKFIELERLDTVDFFGAGSYSKFFRGKDVSILEDNKFTDGWTKEDFKPYHEDLISYLENYHGQKLT